MQIVGSLLGETARLARDLQPAGLALGQHGLNVMVELPDFFRAMCESARGFSADQHAKPLKS